jgi:hypothetical protein
MDGEEFREAGDLNHGVALLRERGERKGLACASAVDKELDQGADSRGVQKRDAAHIEDEVDRSFRTQGLDEIVDGLQAELSGELYYKAVTIRSRKPYEVKLCRLHKLRRLAQNGLFAC